MLLYIIIIAVICLFALGSVFIYVLEKKIMLLEAVIEQSFKVRASLIPALFEITQDVFRKHDVIFRHILNLRMQELLYQSSHNSIDDFIHVEEKIHKELNFIFKVANKHPKLLKNPKFIYTRDLFVECSYSIGKYIDMHTRIVAIYNTYITIKNYSIIGLLLPLKRKKII